MRLLLIYFSLLFSSQVFACTCESGTYFYTLSSLDKEPVEAEEYYKNWSLENMDAIKDESILIERKNGEGYYQEFEISIPNKYKTENILIIFNDIISVEENKGSPLVKKSLFERILFRVDVSESGEESIVVNSDHSSRMKITLGKENIKFRKHIKSVGDSYILSVFVREFGGKINKPSYLAQNSVSGKSASICGSNNVYVPTEKRAIELDSLRKGGCYQYDINVPYKQ